VLLLVQGYGDLHAYSVAEAAFVVVFMFVSIGVAAYFVGTSVLLVAENEKKTGGRCLPDATLHSAKNCETKWHCGSSSPEQFTALTWMCGARMCGQHLQLQSAGPIA
jgi:hypothetical protein